MVYDASGDFCVWRSRFGNRLFFLLVESEFRTLEKVIFHDASCRFRGGLWREPVAWLFALIECSAASQIDRQKTLEVDDLVKFGVLSLV